MNKNYLLVFAFVLSVVAAQAQNLAGTTWELAPIAQALAVGPTQGDFSWWSNTAADVTTRACLFDDEYVFNADGSFQNVMGADTWLEGWQGASPDGCGTPVSPHDGSNAATWSYDATASTLTLVGVGAHLGLPKVVNGGELTAPANAPDSIVYPVVITGDTMMAIDIDFGGGFWHFVLRKKSTVAPADINVTFQVNMNNETPGAVTLGANFEGWSGAIPMTDGDGDGIYDVTMQVAPGTAIEWKFINDGNWESFTAADSACTQDFGGFINRVAALGSSDTTLPAFWYNSCDAFGTDTRNQFVEEGLFTVQPTLVTGMTTVIFNNEIATQDKQLRVVSAVGQVVINKTIANEAQHQLDLSHLPTGMYFIVVQSEGQAQTSRIVVQH